jgi:hypothetical protein
MSILNGFGIHGSVPSIVSSMGGRRVALVAGPSRRYPTIQSAISAASAKDQIFIEPGEYAENVVIPYAKSNIALVAMGGRGSVAIQALTDGVAITNNARDVTLVNIGGEGDGTGGGLVNTGRRFRAYGCKFEGGAVAASMTLGNVLEITALTKDKGDDTLLEDCEIAYADVGVKLTGTDFGACTQNFFKRCYFHSLPDASFEEAHGAGGAITLHYRGLVIDECLFGAADEETDALPTKWISLDDDNANSGLLTRCVFPDILAGGRNLMSTALRSIGNMFVAGIGGAQPS